MTLVHADGSKNAGVGGSNFWKNQIQSKTTVTNVEPLKKCVGLLKEDLGHLLIFVRIYP